MEKAIQKAIVEGNYRGDYNIEINNGEVFTFGKKIVRNDILLDPLFWQALGKALGWNEISGSYHSYNEDGKTAWQMKMHRFIDHLIAGKSVESFFEELNIK